MFKIISDTLGMPQITVQQTQSDWKKFLGMDSGYSGTIPMMKPGTIVDAVDDVFGVARFILAYGVASLQIGDVVSIGAGYATTRLAAAGKGICAVSMAANTDSTALSWFCVMGQVPIRAATMTLGAILYSSATTGSLTSAVTAGQGVTGAHCVLAASGTVTTKTVHTVNGGYELSVPDLEGLYVGQSVSGTGIAGGSTITDLGLGGTMLGRQASARAGKVYLSAAMTATGSVTGTFAHPSTFGTAMLAHPVAAGAV